MTRLNPWREGAYLLFFIALYGSCFGGGLLGLRWVAGKAKMPVPSKPLTFGVGVGLYAILEVNYNLPSWRDGLSVTETQSIL